MKRTTLPKPNLKISLILSITIIFSSLPGLQAQSTQASWQEMMLDPTVSFYETQQAFYDYWEGKTPEKGMGYSVFKRWEYYWSARVDENGNFPKQGHVEAAYSDFQQAYPQSDFKSSAPIWQEMGPRNRNHQLGYMGIGRVNAIAFHPTDENTLYLGAPAGGFWITHDGGENWTTNTDNLVTMGVSAIAVHPENPDRILIGTGDRDGGNDWGVGCMLSEDGGQNWSTTNEGMGEITVGFFAHHETDPNTLLAAANGGLFKTTDFGSTWTKVSENEENYRDIKYKPGDMTTAYASSNGGFYKSTDGGDSWVEITEGISASGRIVIGVSAADPNRVYLVLGGTFQGCFLSTNSGESFALRSDSPNILGGSAAGDDSRNQSWYDLYIHVDPLNANIVHVAGINTWRSNDGGTTWTCTSHWSGNGATTVHADHHCVAYNPLNNRMYDGNDGGIYWTADQGVTWQDISIGLGIGQMYKLGVSATNTYKNMAGFQDNGTATSSDHGWITTGGGDGFECVIDPFTDAYSYSSVYYGSITRWINNSQGARIAADGTNGITESGAWVTPFALSEWDGNTMVIGYKNIWISRNVKAQSGVKWTKISDDLGGSNSTNCSVIEWSPVDENLFYFTRADGKIFRTENLLENPTWIDLTIMKPTGGNASDFECHPYERNTVYMTLNRRLYKSTDLGNTWEDISLNLPDINLNDVVYDRSADEGLYVASDAGVYYKDASMTEWQLFGLALPASVEVTELEIYYGRSSRSECKLRASTYGRGMWESELQHVEDVTLPPYFLNGEKFEKDVELNWNPPLFPNNVIDYSIYRNGELLAKTSGVAYLDRDYPAKTSLTYTVSANYPGGAESAVSNALYFQAPIQLPYEEGFESGTQGWDTENSSFNWTLGNTAQHKISGNDGLFFGISSAYADENAHVTDYLYTPSIDLAEYQGQTVTLQFAHAFRVYMNYDKFKVLYREDASAEWISIADLAATSSNRWIWKDIEVELPQEALVDGVQIGFMYDDSGEHAWGAGLDDVRLFINTSSVLNLELSSFIQAYPNPSTGQFTLEVDHQGQQDISIEILDALGRSVYQKSHAKTSDRIFAIEMGKNLESGLYLLQVRIGKETFTKQILLRWFPK